MQKAAAPEVLETQRLVLRPFVASDAPGLHSCYGDSEAMQYWDFPALRDLSATIAVVADSLATDPRWHRGWAVLLKETQDRAFVGFCFGVLETHRIEAAIEPS